MISGGLFIIAFALLWLAVAYYMTGSNWQSLLPALPVVGMFFVIGAITCIYGYRRWADEKRRKKASPASDH